MKKIFKTFISTALLFTTINYKVEAKQSTNANPWGYTGLINMPTADVLSFGEFYVTGNYLFRNPGFIANAHMGIFDRLELGIVGGIPSAGFSGLAGNLKYQLIKPSAKSPTSLAMGLNLIGLANNTNLVNGNYLYMVLSHDFNWEMKDKSLYNLFSGHVGFGGNLDSSRIMAGIDIPVTEYVNLEAEYLGKISNFDDMINFGVKVKPFPFLTASLLSIGTSTKGFANTEVLFNISYNGKIPNFQTVKNPEDNSTKQVPKIAINPTPFPSPVSTPEPKPTPIPSPIKTPIPSYADPTPVSTPEPKPTVKPTPFPTPLSTPKPAPELPIPTPKPEQTPVPNNSGIVKGQIKGSIGKDIPQKVNITLKAMKGSYQKKTTSDQEGNYQFSDVPKGEYILVYEKEGYQESRKQILVSSGESTEANTELLTSSGSVSGRVLDAKGKSVSNLVVMVDKGKKASTDKEGKYFFNELTAGYHLLSIYKDNKELKSVDLDIIPGTELTKEVFLDSEIKENTTVPQETNTEIKKHPSNINISSTIVGKITDKNGNLKGARIMLEGDKLTVMTVSGQDGAYTVKNLVMGNYKMTVSKPGYVTRIFSVKIKETKPAKLDVNLKLE